MQAILEEKKAKMKAMQQKNQEFPSDHTQKYNQKIKRKLWKFRIIRGHWCLSSNNWISIEESPKCPCEAKEALSELHKKLFALIQEHFQEEDLGEDTFKKLIDVIEEDIYRVIYNADIILTTIPSLTWRCPCFCCCQSYLAWGSNTASFCLKF